MLRDYRLLPWLRSWEPDGALAFSLLSCLLWGLSTQDGGSKAGISCQVLLNLLLITEETGRIINFNVFLSHFLSYDLF